jgi:type 1 fimbriae regulatory protein FimB
MKRKTTTITRTAIDGRDKNFLTEPEMKRFLEAARRGRHGVRDYLLMLITYRHGLRVSELVDIRMKDLDLESGRLYVRRKRGSLSTHQPVEGDELCALRAYLHEQRNDARSPYLFLSERGPMTRQAINYLAKEIGERAKLRFRVHPHMLRYSTGYYLAKQGYDARLVQDYLGHKNIAHTVRYTRTTAARFEGLWQ